MKEKGGVLVSKFTLYPDADDLELIRVASRVNPDGGLVLELGIFGEVDRNRAPGPYGLPQPDGYGWISLIGGETTDPDDRRARDVLDKLRTALDDASARLERWRARAKADPGGGVKRGQARVSH